MRKCLAQQIMSVDELDTPEAVQGQFWDVGQKPGCDSSNPVVI